MVIIIKVRVMYVVYNNKIEDMIFIVYIDDIN